MQYIPSIIIIVTTTNIHFQTKTTPFILQNNKSLIQKTI